MGKTQAVKLKRVFTRWLKKDALASAVLVAAVAVLWVPTPTLAEDPHIVRIGGRAYKFPDENVVDIDSSAVILMGEFPDFGPKIDRYRVGWGNDIRVLFEPNHALPRKNIDAELSMIGPYHAGPITYGLESYIADDPFNSMKSVNKNVYVERDGAGRPTVILVCDKPGVDPDIYPACSMDANTAAINLGADFSTDLLPHWKEILQLVRNYIDAHVIVEDR